MVILRADEDRLVPGEALASAGGAQEDLLLEALGHALRQAADRLRLVAGGLERGIKPEIRHRSTLQRHVVRSRQVVAVVAQPAAREPYQMLQPPSTSSSAPVMKPASSEAR